MNVSDCSSPVKTREHVKEKFVDEFDCYEISEPVKETGTLKKRPRIWDEEHVYCPLGDSDVALTPYGRYENGKLVDAVLYCRCGYAFDIKRGRAFRAELDLEELKIDMS